MDEESMLQEAALSLPSVQDDGVLGEEIDGEGGEEVPVFNRAKHFRSLGITETGPPLPTASEGTVFCRGESGSPETKSLTDSGKEDGYFSPDHPILKTRNTVLNEGGIEPSCQISDPKSGVEWDRFKADFMKQVQGHSEEVKANAEDLDTHLPLEAIAELLSISSCAHSGSHSQEDARGRANQQEREVERVPAAAGVVQGPSTDHCTTTLLSTALLAEINTSALDRALDLVEEGGSSGTGDCGVATGGHRGPKPAWEESKGSAPDLMSRLTAISNGIRSQSQGTDGGRKAKEDRLSEPATHNVLTDTARPNCSKDESNKKTVYIDLRQPKRSVTHQSQSISESEESDDPLSWALKRREIRSALSPPKHNLHHAEKMLERSSNSHNHAPSPSQPVAPPISGQDPVESPARHWQTAESKKRKRKHKKTTEKTRNERNDSEKTNTEGYQVRAEVNAGHTGCVQDVRLCDVESFEDSPTTSSDSVLQSSSNNSIQFEIPTVTDSKALTDTPQVGQGGRHHTTESFTLSSEQQSSYSEGELSPTKPISPPTGMESALSHRSDASIADEGRKTGSKKSKRKRKSRGGKNGQEGEVSVSQQTVDSSPELGITLFATKEDTTKAEEEGVKKAERKKKGDGVKSKKKKKGDAKKKKTPAMRIRLDSLTTSSDEERGIDSPRLSRVEEMVEPLPEKEECEERLRQRLEHKIISKKPPAMFETPATDPLFHKDASFSPVLTHVYQSASTDALVVMHLTSTHGLISLPPSHPHISPEAHLYLHTLILTSLAVSATQCSLSPHTVAGRQTGYSSSPLQGSSKLPFRITAFYQTVLDGQLFIVLGASLPQGRKRSMSYPSVNHQGPRRSGKPTCTLLYPLDTPRSPLAVELDEILCRLKLKDLVGDIMEGSGGESNPGKATMEKVVISSDVQNELRPLLDMSAQAFFSVHPDTEPLTTPTSFYWHSLYQSSCLPTREALCSPEILQSTVCALPSGSLSSPGLVFRALHGAYDFGLSVAGMRLVYGESCSPLDLPSPVSADDTITDFSMCLVLCLRGPDAVSRCMDLVGPEDHSLACVTDPLSIMARFGSPHKQPMFCVRTPFRASAALAKWFGGRSCLRTGTVLGMTDLRTRCERRKRQRVRFSESEFESEDNLPPPTPDISFPPLVANRPLLAVLPYQQLLLVVSPHLPPLCYGSILVTCDQLGFDVSGVKRVRLNSKRAALLDIPESSVSHFTPSSTPPSPNLTAFSGQHPLNVKPQLDIPPLPSLLLVVCRENALVLGGSLKTAILSDLKSLLSLNTSVEEHISLDQPPGALLHTVPYNSEGLKPLGSFSNAAATSVSCLPQLAPEWENEGERYGEEIAVLTVTGASGLTRAVDLLHLLFGVKTEWDKRGNGDGENSSDLASEAGDLGGFEVLGIKLIPQLSRFHAKQLCPVLSTDHAYQEAIELLSDTPALVLVLRGIACNHRLSQLLSPTHPTRSVLTHRSPSHFSLLRSDSLSQAFHHATLFFTDKELFCDPGSWPLLSAVPSAWARADILCDLQSPPRSLHSVLVVRGGEWRLLVKVMDRLHRTGFLVCGLTMRQQVAVDANETVTPDITTDSKGYEVAVCVSRQNAVWYLHHELKPFMSSANNQDRLHCPTVFSDAVSLVKLYFPRGVCSGAEPTDYEVKSGSTDDFSGLRCISPAHPPASPITETTCLVLPPSHLSPPPSHPTPHYLQLLELVAQAGFTVTGIQLTNLSQSSVTALETLGVNCKDLMSGPCLTVALLRDNGASCFQYILKSAAAAQRTVRGVGTPGVDVEELLRGAVVPDSAGTAVAIVAALVKEE